MTDSSNLHIQEDANVAPVSGVYLSIKSGIDFIMAVAFLITFSPVLLVTALVIRLDSAGPAIYSQERVGRFGKLFNMYKFRTMKVGTPVLSTEQMQQQSVIPFTRLGPFLRKTNLDELPQLINILRGQMSFIGPRPALPSQTDVLSLRTKSGADRMRPGITGLAQVMGRDDLDANTKVAYDSEYCRNLGLRTDISILVKTIGTVLSARGNK